MSRFSEKDLRTLLNNVIARAEAILAEAKKRKLHEPTVEFHRGQKILAEQLLHLIDEEESEPTFIKAKITGSKIILEDYGCVYGEETEGSDL